MMTMDSPNADQAFRTMRGKIMTQLEASISDRRQCDRLKSLIRQAIGECQDAVLGERNDDDES